MVAGAAGSAQQVLSILHQAKQIVRRRPSHLEFSARGPLGQLARAHVVCAPLRSLISFAVCWLWACWARGPCVKPAFPEALWRFTHAFRPPPFALVRAASFSPGRLVSFRGVILTSLALDYFAGQLSGQTGGFEIDRPRGFPNLCNFQDSGCLPGG